MPFLLANPLGLWALLGIPAVLLIHLLQRQSRTETISTLFLLDQVRRQSTEGRRIERLRSSIPLWLQLLMVLVAAWLLAQPRWLRPESVQPVAVVLDTSASMSAFRDDARDLLVRELRDLSRNAAITEYIVLTSDLSQPNLYRGRELDALRAALTPWQPRAGQHDFEPALRVARSAVGHLGAVILLTDHIPGTPLPFHARFLAAGTPLPNSGFAGLRIDPAEDGSPASWHATVRNYADTPVTRTWRLVAGTSRSPAQTLQLQPGQILALQGRFPEGIDSCRLELEPDTFPLDDVLPLLVPRPRTLQISASVPPPLDPSVDALLKAIPHCERLAPGDPTPPDLTFFAYDPLQPGLPDSPAVIFLARPPKVVKPVTGPLLPDSHPLMDDLVWLPLQASLDLGVPQLETDRVLLWAGPTPLILLRRNPSGAEQLILNFYLPTSNAARLPAFVLLANRFAERIRARKPTLERRVLETNQTLPRNLPAATLLDFTAWDESERFTRPVAGQALTPPIPGYLRLTLDGNPLLEASTFFADTREADLRVAGSGSSLDSLSREAVTRNTQADLSWTLWLLLLGGLLLASWTAAAFSAQRLQPES